LNNRLLILATILILSSLLVPASYRSDNSTSTTIQKGIEPGHIAATNADRNVTIWGLSGWNLATLQKATTNLRAPIAADNGWKPYTFPSTLILGLIFLAAGGGLIWLGRRIKSNIRIPHPGKGFKITMITTWTVLMLAFLFIYFVSDGRTDRAVQNGPIFPITLTTAILTFVYLFYISRKGGFWAATGNAIAGAAAGPMIFELLFDWIVIPQTNASVEFLVVYFAPLFIIEVTTICLLILCRRVSITRYSLYSLGAMLIVFGLWVFKGYSYPSSPVIYFLNAVSKVLSFTTVIALFITRDKAKPSTAQPEIGNKIT
jgi:hypothetical protein